MSDAFWISMGALGTSMLTALMTVVLAFMSNRTKIAIEKAAALASAHADEASKKADEVSAQLGVTERATDTKLQNLKKVTSDTHTLVNSNMEKALLVSSVALRRVADITQNEGDAKAAEIAEAALAAHRAQQSKVDAAAMPLDAVKEVKEEIQKTLGDITRETLTDVKIVKEDVKELKDEKDK